MPFLTIWHTMRQGFAERGREGWHSAWYRGVPTSNGAVFKFYV